MLISYNWLQKYFKEPLPAVSDLADALTMGIFEIDAVNEVEVDSEVGNVPGKDFILDVKVLPDRAPYCLSHRYIAKEISALLEMEYVTPSILDIDEDATVDKVEVIVDDTTLCSRYSARKIQNVTVTESPTWLKQSLEVLGQRSINNIVDLTNYVMLECGQPLHAFDADKVKGSIHIRHAQEGEEITILGGTVVKLPQTALVVADDEGPLAIAGVKGGQRAEIDASTQHIILESACFERSSVRKTSQLVGIRNESSKRFENGVTPERAGLGMAMFTSHLAHMTGAKNNDLYIGTVTDIYPEPVLPKTLRVHISHIIRRLGVSISPEKMREILERVDIVAQPDAEDADVLVLTIPEYRTDLSIDEDVAEEVGRIYGYDKIEGAVTQEPIQSLENTNFWYHNLLRKHLIESGFSELYTYSLTDAGDIAVQNPLTVERAFMRNTISDLMSKKFLFNMKNADLLGLKEIKLFEIGKVFGGEPRVSLNDEVLKDIKERYALACGIARSKQPKGADGREEIKKYAQELLATLGIEASSITSIVDSALITEIKGDAQTPCTGFVIEVNLDEVLSLISTTEKGENSTEMTIEHIALPAISTHKYKAISPYPFSVRDIAVFLPGEKGQELQVEKVIHDALIAISKDTLLVRSTLFDVFTKQKEGEPVKTSYAYRLVFQSQEKTLSEEEIQECMKAITDACVKSGFEVR